MTPEVVIALIAGLAGLIAAIATAYNSVSKSQIETLKEKQEIAVKAESDRRAAVDASVEKEFQRLHGEVARMEAALDKRRGEVERLWTDLANLRDNLATRDKEMNVLRMELAQERGQGQAANAKAEALTIRTTELEAKVRELLDEREVFIAAMKKAGIEIPQFQRRGDLASGQVHVEGTVNVTEPKE